MVKKELKETMLKKIEERSFGVGDISQYMQVFVSLANESEDISFEVEGWNRTLKFDLKGHKNFSLDIEGGKFSTNNHLEEPDLTLKCDGDVAAKVLTGQIDATSAYMSGDLKVVGALPDAVKFRTIVELVREQLEDEW